MSNILPPTIVKKFQYHQFEKCTLPDGKRYYVTPDGQQLPSVTTILSATKDMTHLLEWRKRMGEEKAAQITKEASGVGTALHANLERFILGTQRQPGGNLVHVQANKMADVIIEHGLSKMSEIWATEQSLYFPGLYSGTTDLIGIHNGIPSICDFKQTNKPKKEEWVEDYYLQLVAYTMCHNEVYGTDIRRGVIFMCSRDLKYQEFILTPEKYDLYMDKWLTRVETYYSKYHK